MISFKKLFLGTTLLAFLAVGMTSCGLLGTDEPMEEGDYDGDFTWAEDDCFEFVYPIEVEYNGERATASSAQELDSICVAIGEDTELTFIYPLQITQEGSDTPTTLENDDQLDEIFFECYGDECPDDEEEPQDS